MDFAIVWTDAAIADLYDIYLYLGSEAPESALVSHLDMLKKFPSIGATYPRGSSGSVREIVYKKYRIFYRVKEARKQIEILTIWHGSRGTPIVSL